MGSTIFITPVGIERPVDIRQEASLVAVLATMIVAVSVLGQATMTGLGVAAALVVGVALTHLADIKLGTRQTAVLGGVHLAAIVVLAFGQFG